jgi:hypothetical protein
VVHWDQAAAYGTRDALLASARARGRLGGREGETAAERRDQGHQDRDLGARTVDELQRAIDAHDRELDTEEQERAAPCDEVFRDGLVWR